jgi:hypothetical protein
LLHGLLTADGLFCFPPPGRDLTCVTERVFPPP